MLKINSRAIDFIDMGRKKAICLNSTEHFQQSL